MAIQLVFNIYIPLTTELSVTLNDDSTGHLYAPLYYIVIFVSIIRGVNWVTSPSREHIIISCDYLHVYC
jgi:hypothetical protein